jgi:hypothetical protein
MEAGLTVVGRAVELRPDQETDPRERGDGGRNVLTERKIARVAGASKGS